MSNKEMQEKIQYYKAQIAKNSPSITHLPLHGNGWDDNVIIDICTLLKDNDYITSIDLQRNRVSEKGVRALAALQNITYLDLALNELNDECAFILANCKNLKSLNVSQNLLTNTGLNYFIQHSTCNEIKVTDNVRASTNYWAKVDAACAYNRNIGNAKESRETYVEKHWKEYLIIPELQLPFYDVKFAAEIWNLDSTDLDLEMKSLQ